MHTHTCEARPNILIPHGHYHTLRYSLTLSTAADTLTPYSHTCAHAHTHTHTHTHTCTYSPFDLKHSCSHPTSHTHMPPSGLTHTHAQTHRLETHQNHCGQRSLKNDCLSVVPRGGGHPEAWAEGHTTGDLGIPWGKGQADPERAPWVWTVLPGKGDSTNTGQRREPTNGRGRRWPRWLVSEEGGSTIDVTRGWTNGGAFGWGWLWGQGLETGGALLTSVGRGPELAGLRQGAFPSPAWPVSCLVCVSRGLCMCECAHVRMYVCICQCAPAFIELCVLGTLVCIFVCVLACVCVYINMPTHKVFRDPSYCVLCTFVLT